MKLPSRIQIIVWCVWAWSRIIDCLLNMHINMIKTFIALSLKIPICIMPIGPHRWNKKRNNIKILHVNVGNCDITQVFTRILDWFWDNELCNFQGGISIANIIQLLPEKYKTTKLYIIYIYSKTKECIDVDHFIDNMQLLDINLYDQTKRNIDFNTKHNEYFSEILFNQLSFDKNFAF